MKVIALIPARLEATRFPRKLLQSISGKTVIRRTMESALNNGLFDEVIVVSDSDEIIAEVEKHGGKAVKSKGIFESGTDRIAEVAKHLEADVFINIQGDEPFVQRAPLEALIQVFKDEKVSVASLVQELKEEALIADPNYVKVALDLNNNALFFSRSIIPFPRSNENSITYFEHIGVYAFRKETLLQFTAWKMTPLEAAEKIECLRFLEHGVPMKMVATKYMGVEIDMPEDIGKAEKFMKENGLF